MTYLENQLYNYKATVNKVIDGDTLVLNIDLGMGISNNNVKCRLLDIDTPELKPTNKKYLEHGIMDEQLIEAYKQQEIKLAKEVSKRVRVLVQDKTIMISTVKDKSDQFNRYLVKVLYWSGSEWIDLSEYLLKEGLASRWADGKFFSTILLREGILND